MSNQGEYKDFIAFLDEDNKKKELSVKILDKNNGLVSFELISGKTMSIPSHRVLKIKEDKPNIEKEKRC